MSYKTLVNSNIRKAFDLLKDLADDATLIKKASEFSFSTGSVVETPSPSISTKVLILEEISKQQHSNFKEKTALLKTQDIGSISIYDTITIKGETFKLGPLITSDRFITAVQLLK